MNRPFKTTDAAQAFAAHAAIIKAESANPSLRDNPFWLVLKQDAYERFRRAFQGAK